MRAGDVGSILVVFLEDRNGKALVRLPNGSKTSLPYDSVDFVVSADGLERPVSGDDLTREHCSNLIAAVWRANREHNLQKYFRLGTLDLRFPNRKLPGWRLSNQSLAYMQL